MKKAIYIPTNQNTVILNELDDHVEVLLEGEYKTVSKSDIKVLSVEVDLSSINILLSVISFTYASESS